MGTQALKPPGTADICMSALEAREILPPETLHSALHANPRAQLAQEDDKNAIKTSRG